MSNTHGLTEEEFWDCQQSFKNFDRDNSESIDCEELGKLLRTNNLKPSNSEVLEILKKFDKDKSGKIEFDEFIEIYKEMKTKSPGMEDIVEAFNFFDVDKNGYLDMNELKYLLCNRGEKLTEATVEKFFKHLDKNSDGKITIDEFKRIMDP
jgi:Ca2+-binding EF-hand superfamily protein